MLNRVYLCLAILGVVAVGLAQYQLNPQTNTGIYAGPGPTSVRYAGQYSTGANTAFNVSAKSADTRVGYANTGVYAQTGVLINMKTYEQQYRVNPVTASPGSVRYTAPANVSSSVAAPVNAQVNGRINGLAR